MSCVKEGKAAFGSLQGGGVDLLGAGFRIQFQIASRCGKDQQVFFVQQPIGDGACAAAVGGDTQQGGVAAELSKVIGGQGAAPKAEERQTAVVQKMQLGVGGGDAFLQVTHPAGFIGQIGVRVA